MNESYRYGLGYTVGYADSKTLSELLKNVPAMVESAMVEEQGSVLQRAANAIGELVQAMATTITRALQSVFQWVKRVVWGLVHADILPHPRRHKRKRCNVPSTQRRKTKYVRQVLLAKYV